MQAPHYTGLNCRPHWLPPRQTIEEDPIPYYILSAHDIKNDEEYAKYSAAAAKVMQAIPNLKVIKFSGRRDYELYEGQRPATQVALFEFESEEVYRTFYYSKEYQEIKKLRLSAADTQFIIGMKP